MAVTKNEQRRRLVAVEAEKDCGDFLGEDFEKKYHALNKLERECQYPEKEKPALLLFPDK